MRWRSTSVLILILVVLIVLYWTSNWWKEEKKIVQEEAKKIFTFDQSAVRELHLQQAGKPLCVGKKSADGKWNFEKPSTDIPAFQLMWDRVAQKLTELKNQRTLLEKVEDKSAYGLDKPALTIKAVVDGMNEPIELAFGFLDPTHTYRYTTRDGKSVFLVDDKQFFELNRSLEDLRFRFLVKDREVPLSRIEFARIWTEDDEMKDSEYMPKVGEESVVVIMERENENAPWYIISPNKGLADQEAVNALASEIQYGVGRDFIDNPENLSDYGLDTPFCRLTYYDVKERKPQTLFLGGMQTAGQSTQEKDKEKRRRLKISDCTGVFAKLAGQNSVFLLDPQFMQLLPRSPESFRNHKIFTRDLTNINKIERIENNNTVFILEKTQDKGWVMTQPPMDDIDVLNINNYIGKLKDIEVESFPGGTWEERGLNNSKDILRFSMANSEIIEIRYVPVPDDNLHCYINQDTGEVGIALNDVISQLWVRPESFRSLLLYRFSPAEIGEIALTLDSNEYIFKQIEGNWTVQKPENKVLSNQGDLLRAIRYLSTLTAAEVSNQKEDEAKVAEPVLKISVISKEKEQRPNMVTGTLTIGSTNESDARYRWAKKDGKEGVYLIKQELLDIVRDMMKSIQDMQNTK
ncbi:MAG TPA: DUF4340 domain-containing protein [Candidatus Hydrogenedens sp.]|nr:DUF4340 domain-containing protein [Candidatus Hydrogenedens sp.]